MRKTLSRLLLLALVAPALAGCAARGDDADAYLRQPLYGTGFRLDEGPRVDKFWVTDGSINELRIQIWVNATAGGARVIVEDPSGNVALDTRTSATTALGLELGAWVVRVEPEPGSTGQVDVLATRR